MNRLKVFLPFWIVGIAFFVAVVVVPGFNNSFTSLSKRPRSYTPWDYLRGWRIETPQQVTDLIIQNLCALPETSRGNAFQYQQALRALPPIPIRVAIAWEAQQLSGRDLVRQARECGYRDSVTLQIFSNGTVIDHGGLRHPSDRYAEVIQRKFPILGVLSWLRDQI